MLDALPPEVEWLPAQAGALQRLETSLTVPLADVSARQSLTETLHRYDPADRVRGGNQAVALEVARHLGDRVQLGTPVVAVRNSDRGATVVAADGRRYDGAVVVLALPLPLLLALHLEPELPAEVRRAAPLMHFGDAAKLHLALRERPVPGGMAAPSSRWWCWTSQDPEGGPLATPLLSCFAGGGEAVSSITADQCTGHRPGRRGRCHLDPSLGLDRLRRGAHGRRPGRLHGRCGRLGYPRRGHGRIAPGRATACLMSADAGSGRHSVGRGGQLQRFSSLRRL